MMINPVLSKELRDRVRTWRSPFLITVYLAVFGAIAGFFFFEQFINSYGGPRVLRMGVEMFSLMAMLQMILIAFLAPGMTAGVISGERERQTLPLLLITRLSPTSVIIGKLWSAISYIFLLIIVSLPMFSIVFFFGGVSLKEFLQVVAVYIATTLMLGSIGLFFSALFKRTVVAIVGSYMVTLFFFIGTLFIALFMQRFYHLGGATGTPPFPFIAYFNPLVALGSLLPMGGFFPFGHQVGVTSLAPWEMYVLLALGIIVITLGLSVWLIHPLRAGTKRGA